MTISESIQQMKHQLTKLNQIDFGYPLGENKIGTPDHHNSPPLTLGPTDGLRWLTELYLAANGIKLPDVHVGYFVKPLSQVLVFDHASEPNVVALDREIDVIPIGSTGGGGLFVVGCDQGNVMLLPPGFLQDGRYDGKNGHVVEVAATVSVFVDRLLSDLTAFVNDDPDHTYIA